eukprot:s648_g18.t1
MNLPIRFGFSLSSLVLLGLGDPYMRTGDMLTATVGVDDTLGFPGIGEVLSAVRKNLVLPGAEDKGPNGEASISPPGPAPVITSCRTGIQAATASSEAVAPVSANCEAAFSIFAGSQWSSTFAFRPEAWSGPRQFTCWRSIMVTSDVGGLRVNQETWQVDQFKDYGSARLQFLPRLEDGIKNQILQGVAFFPWSLDFAYRLHAAQGLVSAAWCVNHMGDVRGDVCEMVLMASVLVINNNPGNSWVSQNWPRHEAKTLLQKLGPGFSSMNLTPKGPYSDGKRPCVADSEVSTLVLNALKRDRFAAVLDDADLENILLQMEVAEVSGVVFREGAPADTVLVLQEGSLEVSVCGRRLSRLDRGCERCLETLGPGACVGTAGVLRNSHLHTISTPSGISALVWSTSIYEICRLLNKWEEKCGAEGNERKLIERIHLFDFLPDKQKARLSELPVRVQVFQAGDLVSSKGDTVSSIFVVKTGRLRGVLDPPGQPTSRLHAKYLPGDVVCSGCCLPQRRQFPLRWHVVADTDCKLLSLDFQTLLQLFGDDLDECLQRAFMVFGLNQVPFMAGFSCTQKLLLAKAMEAADFCY